ncbi:MAG TPA: glycosyltransferase [Candidatus Acidoferrales bacterium]|nr:glycosyltransferase [Candidatus Acidoferrales bacterium]
MKELQPASVILATYNDANILEWSLAAFARQSFRDFELILADDGSSDSYEPILRKWAGRFAREIVHVRHERQGFRKTRIQNRAVSVAQTERLIFVDIDCLTQRNFVRNHLVFLEPGVALTGRRVHIKKEILPGAETVYERGVDLSAGRLLAEWMRGRARVIEHGLELPVFYESRNNGILGCNFSIAKADFAAVNGFNEEFLGRGGEDTDIDLRLRRNGVRVRCLRNKLIEYHLMHEVRVGTFESDSERIEKAQARGEIRASRGLAEVDEPEFRVTRYEGVQDEGKSS